MTDPETISADYALRPSEFAETLTLLVEACQPRILWGAPGCARSALVQHGKSAGEPSGPLGTESEPDLVDLGGVLRATHDDARQATSDGLFPRLHMKTPRIDAFRFLRRSEPPFFAGVRNAPRPVFTGPTPPFFPLAPISGMLGAVTTVKPCEAGFKRNERARRRRLRPAVSPVRPGAASPCDRWGLSPVRLGLQRPWRTRPSARRAMGTPTRGSVGVWRAASMARPCPNSAARARPGKGDAGRPWVPPTTEPKSGPPPAGLRPNGPIFGFSPSVMPAWCGPPRSVASPGRRRSCRCCRRLRGR